MAATPTHQKTRTRDKASRPGPVLARQFQPGQYRVHPVSYPPELTRPQLDSFRQEGSRT